MLPLPARERRLNRMNKSWRRFPPPFYGSEQRRYAAKLGYRRWCRYDGTCRQPFCSSGRRARPATPPSRQLPEQTEEEGSSRAIGLVSRRLNRNGPVNQPKWRNRKTHKDTDNFLSR
jgi:hypothetical protein